MNVATQRVEPEIADAWEWVEPFLSTWARWMRHPGLKLDAPSRTPAFKGDITGGYRDHWEGVELAGQDRAIQVIEAALDDMSPIGRAAVMNAHLYAVWRFRVPVGPIYLNARQRIGVKLHMNDFF